VSDTCQTCIVAAVVFLLQIRVFCRVRPHPQSVVRCLAGGTGLSIALDSKDHPFTFDKVFGPNTQQQQVGLAGYSRAHAPTCLFVLAGSEIKSHAVHFLAGSMA
jgi:hypothetical protein